LVCGRFVNRPYGHDSGEGEAPCGRCSLRERKAISVFCRHDFIEEQRVPLFVGAIHESPAWTRLREAGQIAQIRRTIYFLGFLWYDVTNR